MPPSSSAPVSPTGNERLQRSKSSFLHLLCGSSSREHQAEKARFADPKQQQQQQEEEGGGQELRCKDSAFDASKLALKQSDAGACRGSDGDASTCSSTPSSPNNIRTFPGSFSMPEYMVERTLGMGSSGKVRLCRSTRTGELFALKEIRNAQGTKKKNRLSSRTDSAMATPDPIEGETMACSLPPHENLLRVVEVVTAGPCANAKVVMEAALGGDIGSLNLHPDGVLDEGQLASLMWGALQGVKHLHSLGVVHGDLKPGNLLLGGRDQKTVKVADLGCANRFTEGDQGRWWVSNRPSGTPAYLAPEQTSEEPYLGCPADVWSLGVSIFQVGCKRMPFRGDSILGLYQAIAHDPLPDPKALGVALSDGLIDLLSRMLEKDPACRATLQQVMDHRWFDGHRSSCWGVRS
mmetsp:Transcript_19107/g.53257  ORF Transcript_19107/g.53257 Transcript_19107/m.53257 type:complete len:407 (-) Transcript_19107:254-1474(-)